MDSTLEEVIKKHAEKQGISYKEAVDIYIDYNRTINMIVDNVYTGNIREVRVPFIMRFTFNDKRYEKHLATLKNKDTETSTED